MTGDIQIFKQVILLTLDKSKLTYSFIFTGCEQDAVILLSLGKMLGHEKHSKPSPFDKKFKNHT